MLRIGIIPATLLAGAAAVWLRVPSLVVLVVCAETIAIGAMATSGDSRTFDIACAVMGAALIKFVVFAQPVFSFLLHTKYPALSFLDSDWLIGGIAAISIPLSALYGIYGPLQGRHKLKLFGGSFGKFFAAFAAWLALSVALYAHFDGRDLVAALAGVGALALFVTSLRMHSKTKIHA